MTADVVPPGRRREPYLGRLADAVLHELATDLPALLMLGPRAAGKTTTAARMARQVVRLDRPGEAAAFAADPDAALRAATRPVLLDEWQAVPDVLGAVKRAVDAGAPPGSFLLTGSVRAAIDAPGWPGTGRIVRVPLWGLTVRERLGRPLGAAPFVERLRDAVHRGEPALLTVDAGTGADLVEIVSLLAGSGFPEAALADAGRARRAWLRSYVDQLAERDARALAGTAREPQRLRRFIEAVAAHTATTVELASLAMAAGVNRHTAAAYDDLLDDLWFLDRLPAYSSNRIKRLVRAPRRHVADPALVLAALGLDESGVLADGTLLGRVIESFVVAQLRAEGALADPPHRLSHLRTDQGRREVDVVVELGAERVVGIEVKAGSSAQPDDARHLAWLRDQLGDRFVAGAVLHTGRYAFDLGDRLVAAPIAALWS